ncbi:2Fe-2S iron-sulfur cluster-binding protein [Alsobacter sp. KACC 23698]|uniref:2Fe-2S iron-sulfur cluster-binding protein n=1 Tax=Alsobacter sp. KACC 23698 TaxID=3149229 RepID=A0AAU7JFR2_9HYPH
MPASLIVRTSRLVSGLVLMLFVTGHLTNLALGLVSIDAMEAGRAWLAAPWQTRLGEPLLAAAGIVHVATSFASIAARRSAAFRRTDWVQVVLGLAVIPLLAGHVVVARVSWSLIPTLEISYPVILAGFWVLTPVNAFQQLFVVLVVWVHAAIGLHMWLVAGSRRRADRLVTPLLFGLPIAALLGFAQAGKEIVARMAQDAPFRTAVEQAWSMLNANFPMLMGVNAAIQRVYMVIALGALATMLARILRARGSTVRVDYGDDLTGVGRAGLSILEISRLSDVPHASLCSGRGRCGTCRVRVIAGAENLSPADAIEARVLHGTGPDVRLACRARLMAGEAAVTRLVRPDADVAVPHRPAHPPLAELSA